MDEFRETKSTFPKEGVFIARFVGEEGLKR
jgi:hypothetical protein